MGMEGDRLWLVSELVSTREQLKQHGQVLAAARRSPGAERLVEAAHRTQYGRAERHVRAKPELAGGIQGVNPIASLRGRVAQHLEASDALERQRNEDAVRATAGLLEQDLRRRLELPRHHQASDRRDIRLARAPFAEHPEAAAIDRDVVVGEGDDLAGRGRYAAVAGGRDPRVRFA